MQKHYLTGGDICKYCQTSAAEGEKSNLWYVKGPSVMSYPLPGLRSTLQSHRIAHVLERIHKAQQAQLLPPYRAIQK